MAYRQELIVNKRQEPGEDDLRAPVMLEFEPASRRPEPGPVLHCCPPNAHPPGHPTGFFSFDL